MTAPRLARALRRVGRALRRAAYAVAGARPARAFGAVDGPTEAIAGSVTVWGWAHRRQDPVVAVVVLVESRPAALAVPSEPRPDVAAVRRGGGRSGWSATVDLRDHPGPTVTLSAIALTRSGLGERLDEVSLRLHRGGWGGITRPRDGAVVVPGVVTVDGWALPDEPPARVEIRVNGQPAGRARPLAAPTPDLADTSPLAAAPAAGFSHTLDLSGRKPGDTVRVEADVVTLAGTVGALQPVTLRIGTHPAEPPELTDALRRSRERVVAAGRRARVDDGVRLLVCTHQLDLGGGQLYLFEVLRNLLLDFDVSCLVVSQTDGVLRRELERLGAFVHVCGRVRTESPVHYESSLLELATEVSSHGCNVAFVNTMTAAFGADLARRLGVPAVWAIHESYPLDEFWVAAYGEDGLHPYVRACATEALAGTAAVVFEADATRNLYERHGNPRRFVTVPYGIPLREIERYLAGCDRAAMRRAAGFAADAVVLLCMGTYEPRKGQAALAIAFARVADAFPHAVLVMVGDTGVEYARAVRDVVARLGLENRIRLVPVVEDPYAWYAMADAFVTVSDVESLPRSMLEVMAFGVPVLAASVYGVPEVITDSLTGLLCEARDLESTIAGLKRLLGATREERAGLGAGGRDLVRARYDSSGYVAAYRRLLRGLLEDPTALPARLMAP